MFYQTPLIPARQRAPAHPSVCAVTSNDSTQKPAAIHELGLNRQNNAQLQSFQSELAISSGAEKAAGASQVFLTSVSQRNRSIRWTPQDTNAVLWVWGLFKSNHGQSEMLNVFSHESKMNVSGYCATLLARTGDQKQFGSHAMFSFLKSFLNFLCVYDRRINQKLVSLHRANPSSLHLFFPSSFSSIFIHLLLLLLLAFFLMKYI